ncbi:MAG TPA: polysaccharide deacetylase family protein [Myxococcota bacterium]|nr:polysaccharide deacetylase family protein [Myxococcota bacterium]
MLDLFEESERRATFFALGWVAKCQDPLVREIAARGHEIACHGRTQARLRNRPWSASGRI